MKKQVLFTKRILLGFAGILGLLCGLVLSPVYAQSSDIALQSLTLAEILSDADAMTYEILSDGRLFVAADRLILIDLNDMEIIAEAELPESAPKPEDEFVFRVDQLHELNDGMIWFIYGYDGNKMVQQGYHFDDELNLTRELDLKPYIEAVSLDFMDITSDGSELFYIPDHSDLHRVNLDAGEDTVLLETEMGFDMEINNITSVRLVDNGRTVLFAGPRFLQVKEGSGGTIETADVYGTISPDGENRVITLASEFNVPIAEVAGSPSHFITAPKSSPVAVIVPRLPLIDEEKPEAVRLFALNVPDWTVAEIRLQSPHEEDHTALSENGAYLATGVCEDRGDGVFAFVARLYDTAGGELLDTIETGGLTGCDGAAVGISEAEGLIRAVFREDAELFTVAIPF